MPKRKLSTERDDEGNEEKSVETVDNPEKKIKTSPEEENETNNKNTKQDKPKTVWAPGMELEQDEKLICDFSAYTSFYHLDVEWPFLSFDFIRDDLGAFRQSYPHTFFLAGGTQASESDKNEVVLMKVIDLHKQKDEEEEDAILFGGIPDDIPDPLIQSVRFNHPGACNRIKVMPQNRDIIATWSDLGSVHLWKCSEYYKALNLPQAGQKISKTLAPMFSFDGHKEEGYALAWNTNQEGTLITGGCDNNIHLWLHKEGSWEVNTKPFADHEESVEDLQWSPREKHVFSSCSADGTIRIWDVRQSQNRSCLSTKAHDTDVNVLSWNGLTDFLLASGSDDCTFKIWDLRKFSQNESSSLAHFTWHKGPINSIQFHPQQASTLVVSGEDDQITFWDLSLEEDDEEEIEGADLDGLKVPPQLLFIHQGQKEIKEARFHPQITSLCLSTSIDSLNIFQPDNIQEKAIFNESN